MIVSRLAQDTTENTLTSNTHQSAGMHLPPHQPSHFSAIAAPRAKGEVRGTRPVISFINLLLPTERTRGGKAALSVPSGSLCTF
jgi:hypothetical protein